MSTIMSTIYIVEGSSGMYDEFSTWLVRAFTSEETAKAFAAACLTETARIRNASTTVRRSNITDDVAALRAIKPNCHDPKHSNGEAEYIVTPLPFEAS